MRWHPSSSTATWVPPDPSGRNTSIDATCWAMRSRGPSSGADPVCLARLGSGETVAELVCPPIRDVGMALPPKVQLPHRQEMLTDRISVVPPIRSGAHLFVGRPAHTIAPRPKWRTPFAVYVAATPGRTRCRVPVCVLTIVKVEPSSGPIACVALGASSVAV